MALFRRLFAPSPVPYSCLVLVSLIIGNVSRGCARFYNPQFGSSMADVTVRTGESVEFQCLVKHLGRSWVAFSRLTDTPITIAWDTNIFAGTRGKYGVDRKEDAWLLTIYNVQPEDSGPYMCQVNSVPPISQIANLHVMVPPSINKERSSKDTFVDEGHNATLTCSADGSPPPVYSWRRVQEPRPSSQPSLIITNDPDVGSGESVIHRSTFTIYKVSRHHMADYECIASNGVEPSTSYAVKLHVRYPPRVEPVQAKVYSVKGSSSRLQCKAQAWPRPSFVWKLNDQIITHNPDKYHMVAKANTSNHDSVATLTVRKLVDDDFGNYYCLASNERGHHTAVIELLKQHSDADYYNRIPEEKEDASLAHSLTDDETSLYEQQRDHSDQRQMPRSPNHTARDKADPGRTGTPSSGAGWLQRSVAICVTAAILAMFQG